MGVRKRRKLNLEPTPSSPRWRLWIVPVTLIVIVVALLTREMFNRANSVDTAWVAPEIEIQPAQRSLKSIPFNGTRAYEYLKQICEIGPRVSNTPGMKRQQELLDAHFRQLGAQIQRQEFNGKHPLNGQPVPMANVIVTWHPEKKQRIVLCTHYDTRPYPDRDRVQPRGRFVGANDGGSGTALLMELGHEMPALKCNYGVDFVFFDGEEYVFEQNSPLDWYFLGSTHFAREYAVAQKRQPPDPNRVQYRWGVLLDMVADRDLNLFQERNSVQWPETRPLVDDIWRTAGKLGLSREFPPVPKYEISDDHLPMRNIGGIPTCDLIDFDYEYWHTTGDTVERCSPLSLAKVGWVLVEWLKQVP